MVGTWTCHGSASHLAPDTTLCKSSQSSSLVRAYYRKSIPASSFRSGGLNKTPLRKNHWKAWEISENGITEQKWLAQRANELLVPSQHFIVANKYLINTRNDGLEMPHKHQK